MADQEENNQAAKALYQEKKDLKQKIYDLRAEITLAENEFADKTKEYEYEQEKIKWIAWATKVQD
jgi:predicted  nucleic acid-binding Zn-ribbon protein